MKQHSTISIPAATYYAVYAKMLGLLAPTRPRGVVSDTDIEQLQLLALSIARAHTFLDHYRVMSYDYKMSDAIARAENVTDGSVNTVLEQTHLEELLAPLLVDVSSMLAQTG